MSLQKCRPIRERCIEGPAGTSSRQEPRLLFFSGGSAIKELSAALAERTSQSMHIITPFDSGGSSASLREHFHMPAVGDIRSRITSLAERDTREQRAALRFWERRLDGDAGQAAWREELEKMLAGTHVWLRELAPDLRRSLVELLHDFSRAMPDNFPLAGACLGNLALAGAYFRFGSLAMAAGHCSQLFRVRGLIRPVSEDLAHLAVRFDSGKVLVGQHAFTSKQLTDERLRLFYEEGCIREMWFTEGLEKSAPVSVELHDEAEAMIRSADLICYAPGSFYSSLLANLLPVGLGRAIAANPCPKFYLPSPGLDPELLGYTLKEQVDVLLKTLLTGENLEPSAVLDAILVDSAKGLYHGGISKGWLGELGVYILDGDLIDSDFAAGGLLRLSSDKAAEMLLCAARGILAKD